MKSYNITAQIYLKKDKTRQTIFMNQTIDCISKEDAIKYFYNNFDSNYNIIKIYSIEEYSI